MLNVAPMNPDQNLIPPTSGEAAVPPVNGRKFHGFARYVAVDVKSEFFPPGRVDELVHLYADVFNAVDGVRAKWTPQMARLLFDERLRRPGSVLALFDKQADDKAKHMKIIGAFFAHIVPGRDGMRMTEPDVIIVNSPEYRGQGLGRELSWLGRIRANEVSKELFGEPLAINESETYKNLEFPRDWWVKNGYALLTLYSQTAKELLDRPPSEDQQPKGITFHVVEGHELSQMADFMSARSTRTSDGGRWTKERALIFLKFMHEHKNTTMQAAKKGSEIVSLMMADIIPRRTGPSIVDLHYFTKPTSELKKKGYKATAEEVAPVLFRHLVGMANLISWHMYRLPVHEIEVSNGDMHFLKTMNIMPEIKEDETMVAMRGRHGTLVRNLRPSIKQAQYVSG